MTYDEFLADKNFINITHAIYKFRNKINGKYYIGKTSKSVRTRIIQHMTNSKPWTKAKKSYFQKALNKYGFENFEFSIIENNIKDESLLNLREIYWIGYYKSDQKEFGYNMTPGGEGNTNKNFNKCNIERLRLINLGSKRSQYSKELMSYISKQRFKNEEYKSKVCERLHDVWKNNKKRIVKLDLNYNLMCTYDSVIMASKDIYGRENSPLSRNLNYKNNRVNGFIKNNHIYMFENDYNRRCKHEDDRIIGSF